MPSTRANKEGRSRQVFYSMIVETVVCQNTQVSRVFFAGRVVPCERKPERSLGEQSYLGGTTTLGDSDALLHRSVRSLVALL